ncbi:MAG: hypothetical protein U0800_15545 [Isosphaeraceae bacterium]
MPRTSVPRLNLPSGPDDEADPSVPIPVSQQHAMELARKAFGDGHWATKPDLTIKYYNQESGYWVYAGDYKKQPDGYRVEFFPFAVIWESKDRRGFKAISGEHAYADFEEKFDPLKPSNKPAKIRNAKIEDDVVIRTGRAAARRPQDRPARLPRIRPERAGHPQREHPHHDPRPGLADHLRRAPRRPPAGGPRAGQARHALGRLRVRR